VLAGTPLGDATDASPKLVDALRTADVVAAEDTRRLRSLAATLGVSPGGRVVSFYDAVETARLPGLVDAVREGSTVLLVTDAGMPSVSDPGYRLVAACVAADLPVTCVPGPSAVTTALALSGLPSDRFCFEGFAPRRQGDRRRWLDGLATEPRTCVFFESPHRLATTLAAALDAPPAGRVVSFYDAVETARLPGLVEAVRDGSTVLLVTDAGMPSVSDPGYRLVAACVAAGLPVTCVPGPSAVTTALALSGLASDRFCFEGFAPRRPGDRRRWLAGLATEPRTCVFFESPHRLAATLAAAAELLGGDRQAAVCRELTKQYEEIRRGGLAELAEWADAGVRGEITVVLAGAARQAPDVDRLTDRVEALVADGRRLKDAVAEVAAATGVGRNALYDAVLAGRAAR
jgi:16S rRNA (cytidine1402-2'-O)-methyltransferase